MSSVLDRSEKIYNAWTPARRAANAALWNEKRPDDPDEYTIYNVLCPEIRKGWSKKEESGRRSTRHLEIVQVIAMFRKSRYPYLD
jgi:hypothetical protein